MGYDTYTEDKYSVIYKSYVKLFIYYISDFYFYLIFILFSRNKKIGRLNQLHGKWGYEKVPLLSFSAIGNQSNPR